MRPGFFKTLIAAAAGAGGVATPPAVLASFGLIGSAGNGPSGANRTMALNIQSGGSSFTAATVTVPNWSTSVAKTLRISVAAVPTLASDGTGVTWSTPVDVVVPVASNITSPSSGTQVAPSFASATFNITSIPRTDTPGAPPVLGVRVYDVSGGGVHYAGFDASTTAGVAAAWAVGTANSATGDLTGGGSITMTTTLPRSVNALAASVKIIGGTKRASLAIVGQSQSARAAWDNEMRKYLNLQSGGSEILFSNHSEAGRHIQHQSATVRRIADTIAPQHLAFWNLTVNSPASTQSDIDAQYAIVQSDIAYVKSKGINPILILRHTGGPVTGSALLLTYRQFCQTQFTAQGIDYLDFGAIICDPTDQTKMKAVYDIGDGTHVTDAAYADVMAVFAPQIVGFVS